MRRHLLNGYVLVALAMGAALFVLGGPEQRPSSPDVQAPRKALPTNTVAPSTNASTNSADTWTLMEDYFALLAKNQVPKATELGPQIMSRGTNDWNALNFFSWRIFADRNIKHRDRALALAAAQRALDLTGKKDAMVLDTYAHALFENGRHSEAIECQKKAIQLCTVEAQRIDMEANLNRYLRLSRQTRK